MFPTSPGAELGTILGIWAHPDDEAYLSSALMAQARAAGSRVVCVTATRGEGGSQDAEKWPPETLAQVRTEELNRCLQILGVDEHIFLDLPDVDWHLPLPEEGKQAVMELMRDIQPNSVLTFGPEGMTNHEGHKSVSQWATAAFHQFAPPGAGLYYPVVPRDWAAKYVPRLESLGVYREGAEPPVVDDDALDLDLRLDGELLDLKASAIWQHESQIAGLAAAFGEDNFVEAFDRESFRLAARRPL
jgi:LmbE family N-acetylglucosaminyl deacetylase